MKTDDLLKRAEEIEGKSSISSADKIFENETNATSVFSDLKTKILDINEWNDHALMSTYTLFDEEGREINRIDVGDFIRISLKMSGKYDWVRVIDIYDSPDEIIITVKPTFDPTDENSGPKVTSHFFTDEATNNFCLIRKGEKVAFYVIGLNEISNTSETTGTLETIRNAAVNVATYLGIQKSEWEKFCHHFMADAANENKAETPL